MLRFSQEGGMSEFWMDVRRKVVGINRSGYTFKSDGYIVMRLGFVRLV